MLVPLLLRSHFYGHRRLTQWQSLFPMQRSFLLASLLLLSFSFAPLCSPFFQPAPFSLKAALGITTRANKVALLLQLPAMSSHAVEHSQASGDAPGLRSIKETHHIFHVGSWWIYMCPDLIVVVQKCTHIPGRNIALPACPWYSKNRCEACFQVVGWVKESSTIG